MEERRYFIEEMVDILKIDKSAEWINKTFKSLETDEKLVLFAMNLSNLKSEDFVTLKDVGGVKSAAESDKLRRLGNEAYKQKNYNSALELYSKSVAYAPHPEQGDDSECEPVLALALANRSAVLFEIGKYEQCFKDITFALKMNYPVELHFKVRTRQMKCLQALGRKQGISDCVQDILKTSSFVENVVEELKESLESELKKNDILLKTSLTSSLAKITVENIKKSLTSESESISTSVASSLVSDEARVESTEPKPELKLSFEASETVPGFADCVEVKMTEKMGRGLFATKDIKTGDVIAIHKPFSSVLYKEYFYSHCHHCCKLCLTLIPCFHCPLAMYCSEDCRSVSWDRYHRVECKVLPIITHIDLVPNAAQTLRTVIVASSLFKTMKEFYSTVKYFDEIRAKPRDDSSIVYKDDKYFEYFQVYEPVNLPFRENNLTDYLLAAFLLFLLENRTDFFSLYSNDATKRYHKIFIACLLKKHIFNPCHAITSLKKSSIDETSALKIIGKAVYPETKNLMNHSCNNNVISFSCFGNKHLVRALTSIRQGEQVFDSYGPTYVTRLLKEREMFLSSVHRFTCHCIACTEKWPVLSEMKPNIVRLKCQYCKVKLPDTMIELAQLKKCYNCHNRINIIRAISNVNDICNRLQEDITAKRRMPLRDFIEGLDLLRSKIYDPCYFLAIFQEKLKLRFYEERSSEY